MRNGGKVRDRERATECVRERGSEREKDREGVERNGERYRMREKEKERDGMGYR